MFRSLLIIATLIFAVGAGTRESQATTIAVDTGWLDGTIYSTSDSIPFDFTLTTAGIFSLTDCCAVGDVWTVSGDISGVSTVGLAPVALTLGLGSFTSFFDPAWTSAASSFIQLSLAAGSYSFSVSGDGGGGLSASFGVRVDTSPVPIPAAGLLLFGALAGMGAVSRRRKVSKKA